MNTALRQKIDEAVSAVSSLTKTAFVPGPSVQAQLQRLQEAAADQQSGQQSTEQALQQIDAQAQGAPPAMRIEDLAGMVQQLGEQMMGALSQVGQMLQQMQMAQQAAAQPAQGAAGGGAAPKPKKEDMLLEKLTSIEGLLSQAISGAPPPPQGGAPMQPDPNAQPMQ